MQCDVITDRTVNTFFISFKSETFNTAERSSSTAESCITKTRVVIVQLASCERIRIFSCKEIVQIFLVRNFLDSEVLKVIIIQPPADIIVAAEIVLEHIISRKSGNNIKLTAQQGDISCCNSVPGACHSSYIVKQVAFRFIYSSEVWNDFFRSHDNFPKEQYARADDLADHTHHTNDGVNLWQVTAVGSKLFPDIWYSIQTNDIHTLIGKIQHIKDHFIENNRIAVIQIPLIRIEGSHNMFMKIFQPGKVARCSSWENFRAGLLI